MSYDPEKHQRRALRLQNYNYAQAGAYFVTICTYQRQCILSEVSSGEVTLSPSGEIAAQYWQKLPEHYALELDAWVIMPNHLHGIVLITQITIPLFEMVRSFKTFSAKTINHQRGMKGVSVWQRQYYDHVIRDDADLDRIRAYIKANPTRWSEDDYYTE